jgi:hypothetical protein
MFCIGRRLGVNELVCWRRRACAHAHPRIQHIILRFAAALNEK